jgi:ABC-2 type transport system permease protein
MTAALDVRRTSPVALVAAERIKLLSVRSPWWTSGLAVLGVAGLTGVQVLALPEGRGAEAFAGGNPFLLFALVLAMVMGTVSVTTEYRFGTVRGTFQAVPDRSAALLAKAFVVAVAGAVVGIAASIAAWLTVWVLLPLDGPGLSTADDWRMLLGPGAVFAVGAVLAMAVGVLLRQTAGAVSLLLVWTLLLENLIGAIPEIGDDIARWLPLAHAANAVTAGDPTLPFGPWGSLAYFAAVTAAVLVAALAVANRRDA